MPLAVEDDKLPDPVNVGFFRADAVMEGADLLAHLREKFRGGEGASLVSW